MKEYNFTIEIVEGPAKGEFVFIDVNSNDWDTFVTKERFIGIASFLVQDYLSSAYCMYGQLFDQEKHSPRQIYEALSGNKDFNVVVDGEIPDDDEDNEDEMPSGAVH